MNWVREAIEHSYTNFKLDIGVNGFELITFPIIIISLAFVFGAGYSITRTLTQIHVDRFTFIQKDFLIGCGFFSLAAFNAWAIIFMDLVLDWYDLLPYTAYALSIVWLIPAISGLCYFEKWKKLNLQIDKKGIKKLPEWVLPTGLLIVAALLLFGMIVFIIEYSMNTDCSRIGTGEDSTLTEQEAVNLRVACESSIDNTYIFAFVVTPLMVILMFSYTTYMILKPVKEGEEMNE